VSLPIKRLAGLAVIPVVLFVAVAATIGTARAELVPTPALPPETSFPRDISAETDTDLARIAGRAGSADGSLLLLSGRVLDAAGREVADARVEIWHADAQGRQPGTDQASDQNFQGYGRSETGGDGRFGFRTIRPGAVAGRAPHIHVRISAPGFGATTTQIFFAGEKDNERDPVLGSVRDPAARARLVVPLQQTADAEQVGVTFRAEFDIILGFNRSAPA